MMPTPHEIPTGVMTDAERRLERIRDAAVTFELLLDLAMATAERKDDPPCTT